MKTDKRRKGHCHTGCKTFGYTLRRPFKRIEFSDSLLIYLLQFKSRFCYQGHQTSYALDTKLMTLDALKAEIMSFRWSVFLTSISTKISK